MCRDGGAAIEIAPSLKRSSWLASQGDLNRLSKFDYQHVGAWQRRRIFRPPHKGGQVYLGSSNVPGSPIHAAGQNIEPKATPSPTAIEAVDLSSSTGDRSAVGEQKADGWWWS
jgi:hypothetical protein